MNRLLRPIAVAALALVLFAPAGKGEGGPPTVAEAIRKGVAFLVRTQNRDGSWGSPAPTLTVDIYAPSPACHDAYRVGTTGLAVAALAEAGAGEPGAAEAARRGADWLVANGDLRRGTQDVLYNVWGHAYALEAYARLLEKEKDEALRATWRKAAAEQVARLARFEYVDGGWGYYDFQTHTRKPGPGTTSFMTATCLVALRMAADQGVEVPKGLVTRGLEVLRRSRFPNGAFSYSIELRLLPQMPVNKVKGSLARTPACLLAMNDWAVAPPEGSVAQALDVLEKEGRFLLIARKYTYPHETWYQNSGYFCFYGYYYASRLLGLLPEEKRPAERARIASHLLPLQEQDGSFWDYQLYGYHKAYGTAYVLMALHHCR